MMKVTTRRNKNSKIYSKVTTAKVWNTGGESEENFTLHLMSFHPL